MRRSEKEIKDPAVITDMLNACHVGRLATNGRDGYPRIKPLNFALSGKRIYFHSAPSGEKMEDMTRDPRVSFEVDLPIAYMRARRNPCEADYLYRSVLIKGRASFVTDRDEAVRALNLLMDKYQPGGAWGDGYTGARLSRVAVVRIDIEEMRGKEDLGQGRMKAAAIKALEDAAPLPITVERDAEDG